MTLLSTEDKNDTRDHTFPKREIARKYIYLLTCHVQKGLTISVSPIRHPLFFNMQCLPCLSYLEWDFVSFN